ncbi:ATP-binding protein [Synergistaceae bacterium OttesenSCG-928-I11]|nr:ATP-binding protein [Synergistaceae bacterium OttesenSCG-928-I11]
MIQRREYLKKLLGFRDRDLIKVVTGIRRCGKSTLLQMFRDLLADEGIPEGRITFLDFEDMDNAHLRDPKTLHDYIVSRLSPDVKNYVFLDEVQNVRDFPSVVDSLFIRKNVDLYVTGSNAHMLSGEIATQMSGRYVEIFMLPLSFSEYLLFPAPEERSMERKYADYLRYGSFPYATQLAPDTDLVADYLGGIYNTVVLKDVVARTQIANVGVLDGLIRFMADNIGCPLSTKKISDTLSSSGRGISPHTVDSYLSALENAFIFYRARRYDVKGKAHLKTGDKYYIVDIGLRYWLLGSRSADVGRMLENVVYLELRRRHREVYVGKAGEWEIDFVTMDGSGLTYYQVAATVRDENTLARELRPLRAIKDSYPKYLLTLDNDPPADYDGILRTNALDFLAAQA